MGGDEAVPAGQLRRSPARPRTATRHPPSRPASVEMSREPLSLARIALSRPSFRLARNLPSFHRCLPGDGHSFEAPRAASHPCRPTNGSREGQLTRSPRPNRQPEARPPRPPSGACAGIAARHCFALGDSSASSALGWLAALRSSAPTQHATGVGGVSFPWPGAAGPGCVGEGRARAWWRCRSWSSALPISAHACGP